MQRPETGTVVVGVDTHKEVHVAAVVDHDGNLLDESTFPTTRQGSSGRKSRIPPCRAASPAFRGS